MPPDSAPTSAGSLSHAPRPMDPDSPDLPPLLQALRAAPEPEVAESAEGVRLRAEQGPGWAGAVLEPAEPGSHGAHAWRHDALAGRPEGYPRDVPFLAGATGLVVRTGERTSAVWPWRDEEAPASLETLSLMFAAPPKNALDLFLEAGDAELEAALGEGLELLVAEALAAGWKLEEEQLTGTPFAARQLQLTKPGRILLLTLSSTGGRPELVLLELPARS